MGQTLTVPAWIGRPVTASVIRQGVLGFIVGGGGAGGAGAGAGGAGAGVAGGAGGGTATPHTQYTVADIISKV